MHQHSHLCLTQSRTVIWDFYPSAESKTDTKPFHRKTVEFLKNPLEGYEADPKPAAAGKIPDLSHFSVSELFT